MNKYANNIILSSLVILLLACSEEILDKVPQDAYSESTVWTDVNLASSYLDNCYNSIQSPIRYVMMSAACDETFVSRGSSSEPYNLGTISADRLGGQFGNPWFTHVSWAQFPNLQAINLFLENIDEVSEAYTESEQTEIKAQTELLKGEAIFLRAWIYHNLCRNYGGVPLMSKANQLGDDFSSITRATFEETVNFIVEDCDRATELLKLKSETEMGRATKEAALALKSRILLFAASDLTADGTAENELVGYASPNRTALWTAARDAAKAVIDLGTHELANFGAPDQEEVAQKYFEFFKAYDLSNDEVIWGKMFVKDRGTRHRVNQWNGPNGNNNFGRNGPLQSMVDEYEMNDGSKFFDHFSINEDEEYINNSSKFQNKNPYKNREPRFYGTVLYDSAMWQPRVGNNALRDPLGIYDRRTRRNQETGDELFGLDTRKDPYFPAGGCYGGYLTKKFMDDAVWGDTEYNENIAIYIRYAEILFNYAEASLELGEIETATTYINMIRNRAGLPDFTGDITEALRHEKKVELFAEEHRWYDIRRWKILEESMSPPLYGIDILEIQDGNGNAISTRWKRIEAQVPNNPSEKLYWIPIQTDELKKAPQLEQNPGY
jgi:starch-binding outer membrane protein, SusD/RagB family